MQVQLTQGRTSVGRRPYNDIVLEHLSVSGEHAVLLLDNGRVTLQDLDSTNGSYVNGQAVRQQPLAPGDVVELGACRLTFEHAHLQVLTGTAAGREMAIVKPVFTLGQSGVPVATISRLANGYVLTALAEHQPLHLNGSPVGLQARPLRHGDLLAMGDTQMQFLQA